MSRVCLLLLVLSSGGSSSNTAIAAAAAAPGHGLLASATTTRVRSPLPKRRIWDRFSPKNDESVGQDTKEESRGQQSASLLDVNSVEELTSSSGASPFVAASEATVDGSGMLVDDDPVAVTEGDEKLNVLSQTLNCFFWCSATAR